MVSTEEELWNVEVIGNVGQRQRGAEFSGHGGG